MKWLGFSAHSTRAALEALKAFPFDTVMFPIGIADYYLRDFGREVIEAAERRGSAVVAIKPMSMGAWPRDAQRTRDWWYKTTETQDEVSLALRFSLSLRGVVAGVSAFFCRPPGQGDTRWDRLPPATRADKDQLRDVAQECVALFTREDERGNSTATNFRGPFPDHPYGFGIEDA